MYSEYLQNEPQNGFRKKGENREVCSLSFSRIVIMLIVLIVDVILMSKIGVSSLHVLPCNCLETGRAS